VIEQSLDKAAVRLPTGTAISTTTLNQRLHQVGARLLTVDAALH